MKICVLVWSVYESDSRVRRYSEALAERGDLVDVICLSSNHKKKIPIKYNLNGVNVYEVGKRLQEKNILDYLITLIKFFFISFYYTTKLHIRQKYDLIHVHSLPDFEVFAALIPKLFAAKIILDIHDPLPDFYKAKYSTENNNIYFKILSLLEWLSTKFADHVITVTDYWKDVISKRSHIPDSKISVILNLPDTRLFNPEKYANKKSSKIFTLLYPGTLNKHCGIDIVIKAVKLVKEQIPSLRFMIYGKGGELKSLQLMVRDLDLENIIFFYDNVPLQKIPQIMSEADVGIALLAGHNKYSQQALNVKLFEFLAMGLPSIASKTKSIEYYLDEKVVELSEPNNYKDVARCIKNLYLNPDRRQELKKNGLNYISRNNWNLKKTDFFSIVDKLIS